MGMKTLRALVAEDNTDDFETIRHYLEAGLAASMQLTIERAFDGEEALTRMREEDFGLVILDVNLPKKDGQYVLKGIRNCKPFLPIIATSSFGGDFGEAMMLNAGADDFIAKPFSMATFLAHVKTTLWHGSLINAKTEKEISWGRLTINVNTRSVRYAKKALALSDKEFCLLLALVRAQGRTVDADLIEMTAWGSVDRTSTRLESKIKTLRDKLAARGAPRDFIDTNRGIGYVLRDC